MQKGEHRGQLNKTEWICGALLSIDLAISVGGCRLPNIRSHCRIQPGLTGRTSWICIDQSPQSMSKQPPSLLTDQDRLLHGKEAHPEPRLCVGGG